MWLLLVLSVAVLSRAAGAAVASEQLNITDCPVTVFGRQHGSVYVSEYQASVFWCFDGFKESSAEDCLHTRSEGVGAVSLSLTRDTVVPSSEEYPSLPGVQGNSSCSVQIQALSGNSTAFTLVLRVYGGTFGVVSVKTNGSQARELYLDVGPETNADVMNITAGESELSLSGCRHPALGVVLRRDSKACLSNGSVGVCSAAAAFSSAPCSHCHNGECLLGPWCAVTGSTVTDVSGALASVPDRCGYSLLSQDGLQLSAVFRERRRRDVTLLDHLLLTVGSSSIHIGPRGVQLDGVAVNLSAAQMPPGISVSRSPALLSLTYSQHFELTFDGDSALVLLKGLNVSGTSGLCIDASMDQNLAKSSALSLEGCDTDHTDPVDPSIDCASATQHCNLLNGSHFAACHSRVDPTPFVSSCARTLCSYPPEGGLECSFHRAYHALCSRAGVTLGDWTAAAAQCGNPDGRCLDTYCSDHEFCDVVHSRAQCLCRAVFAHKYKSNKTLGEPTVCRDGSATVLLVGCLLNEKGIKYSDLRLTDPSCRGALDPETHMVQFQFDRNQDCGTQVLNKDHQMVFKNSIRMKNQTGMVTRHDQFTVDFSCFYNQPGLKTVALRIKDSSVVQKIVSGAWSYNLTMTSYLDGTRTQPVGPTTELALDQTIWVQLDTEGLASSLVSVVTDSCWATSHAQPDSQPRYDLLQNGCATPQDPTVRVVGNGLGTSNYFSFRMFQFTGSTDVYLHCRVELCSRRNTACLPNCGSRRRRSVIYDPNPALITLSWAD